MTYYRYPEFFPGMPKRSRRVPGGTEPYYGLPEREPVNRPRRPTLSNAPSEPQQTPVVNKVDEPDAPAVNKTESYAPVSTDKAEAPPASVADQRYEHPTPPANNETNWKAKALQLQAEMDNFRKRQMRRADAAMDAERERLLALVLPVADNLARALAYQEQSDETLQQGVELTYRELMRLLEGEGVTRLETVGQRFDPAWHEAVAIRPAAAETNIIVDEIEAGYKLGDKLLRPARVVVAA